MTWQTVVTHPSALGESPFWHPNEQRLYWVDIPGCKILRLQPETGVVDAWPMPQEPGCIAPARTGGQGNGLVIALRDGVYRASTWGGPLVQLAASPYDVSTTRFNDGKCDAQGRLWAGTIYEPRDAAKAALYCLDARGIAAPALQARAGGATTANGLAWSPDGRKLYWADTPRHVVHVWDFEAATGALMNPRVFHQFAPKPAGWTYGAAGYGGRPDGAAVDVDGNYYCAMFEGARLVKLSPAGTVLDDIPTPVGCPTMPCFGGDDLRTLYLTTARHNRPAAELQAYPQSGCVFAMRVDTPGLPVNFFLD